jgi:hypothetical protein
MSELYVLALYDSNGAFRRYVRKGRNNAISGYDNLAGARRGLSHSRNNYAEGIIVKIVKATELVIIPE